MTEPYVASAVAVGASVVVGAAVEEKTDSEILRISIFRVCLWGE